MLKHEQTDNISTFNFDFLAVVGYIEVKHLPSIRGQKVWDMTE